MSVASASGVKFDLDVEVLVVGAGACGHCAALSAKEGGLEVLVVEREAVVSGSTALSSGLIPGAGTRWQRRLDIEDTPERFHDDILKKSHGEAEPTLARIATEASAGTLEWLSDQYDVPFSVVDDYLHPGHSVLRMHGTPTRSGAELLACLNKAAVGAGIDIVTSARVRTLFADDDGRTHGVELDRPDGSLTRVGCRSLILACNGFGGNKEMLARLTPEIAEAPFLGHAGNVGDAILWGEELGAASRDMGAYIGHGSVAQPHGIGITWGTIMEGGVQVNKLGQRFSDESRGYSEQAVATLAQPGGMVWQIFDERIDGICRQFSNYRDAVAQGAIRKAHNVEELALTCGLPLNVLARTLADVDRCISEQVPDEFGRVFRSRLQPPYCAIRVSGALYQTLGGLVVDSSACVLRKDGTAFPNLLAGGGAACGIAGSTASGYISGSGLLMAVTLGRIAGRTASRIGA